jgi:hypothetical protein
MPLEVGVLAALGVLVVPLHGVLEHGAVDRRSCRRARRWCRPSAESGSGWPGASTGRWECAPSGRRSGTGPRWGTRRVGVEDAERLPGIVVRQRLVGDRRLPFTTIDDGAPTSNCGTNSPSRDLGIEHHRFLIRRGWVRAGIARHREAVADVVGRLSGCRSRCAHESGFREATACEDHALAVPIAPVRRARRPPDRRRRRS